MEQKKCYLSIVDVIAILTDSPNALKYWSVLKKWLKAEESQLTTNCSQLKMPSADGKFYLTDIEYIDQHFYLIQSIPSPKAETFKLWLAKVASERLDEMQDLELSIGRNQAVAKIKCFKSSVKIFTYQLLFAGIANKGTFV